MPRLAGSCVLGAVALAVVACAELARATPFPASVLPPEVKGSWVDGLPASSRGDEWRAQWIWSEDTPSAEMILARNTFRLAEKPPSARLRITASTLYELHVNGRYVGRGPARSAAHHQSFDDLEIAPLLEPGENVIAVRVHYQRGAMSYGRPGRGGLLAQLDIETGDGGPSAATGDDWRVLGAGAWSKPMPLMNRFNLESNDRVDLRRFPAGWVSLEFDASAWPTARVLQRETGWPAEPPGAIPGALTPPWTSLRPRDLPYLQEERVVPVELLAGYRTGGRTAGGEASLEGDAPMPGELPVAIDLPPGVSAAAEAFVRRGEALTIPSTGDDQDVFLLFDLGKVYSGLPFIEIEAPSGTGVDVMCAPFIRPGGGFSAKIVDSTYLDRVVLPGRRVRWRATYFKPTRYLGLLVRGGGAPFTLHGVGVDAIAYPFASDGHFRSPDEPWWEELWQAAARTIRVSTTDAYTDNYRERRQYVQTAYYAALGNYWAFGDTTLHRRCLRQAAEEQRADGWMPAYAPLSGDDDMVILDSNTAWVRGLRAFYLHSGDEASVRSLLPAARKLMHWLHGYTDARGLIERPPYPYWIDHARLDRRGASFSLNAHYLGALEDLATVLEWLGEAESETYRARATRLRSSLQEEFWNPEHGLFCDALVGDVQSESFSEQANGMALAMQVATAPQAEAIVENLLAPDGHNLIRRANGMTMVTPATSYLFHLGLCRYGHVEESLAELRRRFAHMLEPGTNQTLWEEWWLDGTGRSGAFVGGRTRSDAQTESAFAPALLGEYVLGLQPVAPGCRKVRLRWRESGLGEVSGVMPSPLGPLSVHWQPASRELHLRVPPGMEVQLDRASLPGAPHTELQVDGREIGPTDPSKPLVTLRGGVHHVRF